MMSGPRPSKGPLQAVRAVGDDEVPALCHHRGMLRSPSCALLLAFISLAPRVAGAALPDRVWGTYVGAEGDDVVVALAVDAEGMLYACGTTRSTKGIATPGSFQESIGQILSASRWRPSVGTP